MEFLTPVLNVAMVVVGIGFVIFIHELGHFLLAKWNGVKVEKFALGFDFWGLRLWSRKVGETEYVLGAIPLGGYVKMLGEEPTVEEGQERSNDPRAYHNRPVGGRMAIISAGVVMNLIFGLLCFTYAYLKGKLENPSVLGGVVIGSPAYQAGLQPGDRVVAINGKRVETYGDIRKASAFSGRNSVLKFDISRPGEQATRQIEVVPEKLEKQLHPTIGVLLATGLTLDDRLPFLPPPGLTGDPKPILEALKSGGQVVSVAPQGGEPQAVGSKRVFDVLMSEYRDRPVTVGLQPAAKPGSRPQPGEKPPTRTVTVPPNRFVDFGFRLTPGPVASIRKDSPAAKAGIQVGDRLLSIDGRSDFDPMRLPDEIAALVGRADVPIEVARKVEGKPEAEQIPLYITPVAAPLWTQPIMMEDEPLDVPGLGLAIPIEAKVAAVTPDSPAAKAGIVPGDTIEAVTLTLPSRPAEDGKAVPKEKPETRRFVLGGKKLARRDIVVDWPFLFDKVQTFPAHEVEIFLAGKSKPVRIAPVPVDGWYYPERGLQFSALIEPLPPQPLPAALRRAWDETVDNITMVYFLIRGLFERTMSKDAVGGLPKIAEVAYAHANAGFDQFLGFLAMLSINLAVINFLPIFPLDGGQFVFLLYEKIAGRPLPDRLVGPIQVAGIVFVLALILFVNLNDVWGYLASYIWD